VKMRQKNCCDSKMNVGSGKERDAEVLREYESLFYVVSSLSPCDE
jgi:hypothetical protein